MGLLRSMQCLLTARASSYCLPALGGFISLLQHSRGDQSATAACTRSVLPVHSFPHPTVNSLSSDTSELSACSGARLIFPALLLLVMGKTCCISRSPSLRASWEPTRTHCHGSKQMQLCPVVGRDGGDATSGHPARGWSHLGAVQFLMQNLLAQSTSLDGSESGIAQFRNKLTVGHGERRNTEDAPARCRGLA